MRVPTTTELNNFEINHNRAVTNDLMKNDSGGLFFRVFYSSKRDASPDFEKMISVMFGVDNENYPEFAKAITKAYEVGKIGRCLHLIRALKTADKVSYEVFKDIVLGEACRSDEKIVTGLSGTKYRIETELVIWTHDTGHKAMGFTDILFNLTLIVFRHKRRALSQVEVEACPNQYLRAS